MAERALQLDVNNTIALNYYYELTQSASRPEPRGGKKSEAAHASDKKTKYGNNYGAINMEGGKPKDFHLKEIILFIVGAACMFGLLYVLVLPAIYRDNNNRIVAEQMSHAQAAAELNEKIDGLSEDIEGLTGDIAMLNRDISDLERQLHFEERVNQVLTAYRFFSENEMQTAVNELNGLSTAGLPPDIIEIEQQILSVAYPRLATQYAAEGVAAYNARDLDLARERLSLVLRYAAEDAIQRADALYFLGIIYMESDNADEDDIAREYFLALIENFPGYRHIRNANQRLASLGGV
jgi:TolA-binding protein